MAADGVPTDGTTPSLVEDREAVALHGEVDYLEVELYLGVGKR